MDGKYGNVIMVAYEKCKCGLAPGLHGGSFVILTVVAAPGPALFASLSAVSFPLNPQCAGLHWGLRLTEHSVLTEQQPIHSLSSFL